MEEIEKIPVTAEQLKKIRELVGLWGYGVKCVEQAGPVDLLKTTTKAGRETLTSKEKENLAMTEWSNERHEELMNLFEVEGD